MALLYIGGETAQVALQLPTRHRLLFQGMLLFFLLAATPDRLRRSCCVHCGMPAMDALSTLLHRQRIARRDAAAARGLGELVAERAGVLNLGVEG